MNNLWVAAVLRTFSCATRVSKRELLCAGRHKDAGLMDTFCRKHPSPSPRPAALRSGSSGQSLTGLWAGEEAVFPRPLLSLLGKLRSVERRELPG